MTKPTSPTSKETLDSHAQLIDEYGSLDAELALIKPKTKRREELQKLIQSWYADLPAEDEFRASGHKFTVLIGQRKNERTILDIKKLFKFLKLDVFLKICTVPLKSIDALLNEEQRKGIIAELRTGSRPIVAVPNQVESK